MTGPDEGRPGPDRKEPDDNGPGPGTDGDRGRGSGGGTGRPAGLVPASLAHGRPGLRRGRPGGHRRGLPVGELRGRPRWPPGAPGDRHRALGRRDRSAGLRARVQGGDRERPGLPDLERVPRRPERPVRLLRLRPEQQLLDSRRRGRGRTQRLPPRRPPRLHRPGGRRAGGPAARPQPGGVRGSGHRRYRALAVAAGGCHQPRRTARDGHLRGRPRRDRPAAADRDGRPVRHVWPTPADWPPERPSSGSLPTRWSPWPPSSRRKG